MQIKEMWSGNSNMTKTLNYAGKGFGIINDGTTDLSFEINGGTMVVKPKEMFQNDFAPFKTVKITTTSNYRAFLGQ